MGHIPAVVAAVGLLGGGSVGYVAGRGYYGPPWLLLAVIMGVSGPVAATLGAVVAPDWPHGREFFLLMVLASAIASECLGAKNRRQRSRQGRDINGHQELIH